MLPAPDGSGPGSDVLQEPMAPPGPSRDSSPGRGSAIVSPIPGLQTHGLVAERRKLLGLGLPPAVVTTIRGARAPSTNRAYQARWRVFQTGVRGETWILPRVRSSLFWIFFRPTLI